MNGLALGRFLRWAGNPSPLCGCASREGESTLVFPSYCVLPISYGGWKYRHIDFLALYSRFLPHVGWGGWICTLKWKKRAENLQEPIVFAIFKYYTLTLNVNLQSMSRAGLLETSSLPFFRILWVLYMKWPKGHQAKKPLLHDAPGNRHPLRTESQS